MKQKKKSKQTQKVNKNKVTLKLSNTDRKDTSTGGSFQDQRKKEKWVPQKAKDPKLKEVIHLTTVVADSKL